MPTRKIGRDATSGRFISVIEARERPATAPARQGGICIETIHVSRNGVRRLKRRRAVRSGRGAPGSRPAAISDPFT
jgi:hypothetical protein